MTNFLHIAAIRDKELEKNNSSFNVHDNLKSLSVEELQDLSKADRVPWHTMALNLTGDLNVGSIIRTSHLLGAASVITVGRTKIDRRSLVGSANYIKVERLNTMDDDNLNVSVSKVADILDQRKLTPIFCESGGIDLNKVNWTIRLGEIYRNGFEPCLVMGNETGGIDKDILELINYYNNSFIVSIPQRGVIRSLNVSVAHGIIAGHMVNQMDWFDIK